ncbi:hypothetical protein S2091_0806 [Solimicrobium silvestre]|uniref:Uncharacterized protein n=1 Tax=Solimicrobium silvestre TaxID=2099400 RepID=A0A2S9H4D9_9BURK|nr:hypothetical protein S2091_0806 [Solimicrobium silvestre]
MTRQNQTNSNRHTQVNYPISIKSIKLHKSRNGYEFNEDDPYWILNKNITVNVCNVRDKLDEEFKQGFTLTLVNYAKFLSAAHTANIGQRMNELLVSL